MVTLKNPQKFVILTLMLFSAVATAKENKAVTSLSKEHKVTSASKERKAIISTSEGDITVKLFLEETPKTVLNFIGLSNGKKEWKDPRTGNPVKGKPLYNKTTFHRVIPDFMIQGGDPLGNGTGGPGYQFEDETNPKVVFDHPGILAMANSGPATNGSQFFITVKPTPWLNGKHTIFGEVVKGMDIVEKISKLPTGAQDAPQKDVVIKKIKIIG
jgi:peptidyl-prolyl cis-trans isomerase A (cyclophilin A)